MTRNQWWRRLVGGLVAFGVLEAVLVLARADPDAVRLALLVATCVAVLGLVVDALSDGGVSWEVEVERPSARERGDQRLAAYLRLLEAHEAARSPDPALRDRLRELTDRVLTQRHGLTRTDPRAVELLGADVLAVLDGPPRRLPPAEVDHCLTRIEEL
jgi:hypothetical protein